MGQLSINLDEFDCSFTDGSNKSLEGQRACHQLYRLHVVACQELRYLRCCCHNLGQHCSCK